MPDWATAELAKLGLAGLCIAGLSWVSWNLLNRLNTCWEGREAVWKSVTEVVSGNNAAMRELSASSDARTRSVDGFAEAQRLAAAAQLQLTAQVTELRAEIVRLREGGKA